MEKKPPTAYEFCQSNSLVDSYGRPDKTTEEALIEFAKLHVQAALDLATKQATTYSKGCSDGYESWDIECVNKDSIINSYPLTNVI